MLDVSVYELVWPTPLFTAEAERVSRSDHRQWVERARLLLGEAFAGTTAVGDFDEIGESSTIWADDDPWSPKPPAGQAPPAYTQRTWLRELIDRAAELRHAHRPRPYWPQRHSAPSDHTRHKGGERRDFARLVEELDTNGYLAEVFDRDCVDDPDPLPDRSRIPAAASDTRTCGPWTPTRGTTTSSSA